MWLDVPPLWLENPGTIPAGLFVLCFVEKPPLHQEPQGLHCVIVVDAVLRFHGHHSFTQIKTQGRAQPCSAVPVCSILKIIVVDKSLKFASRPSVEGVYSTGSGLPALSVISPPPAVLAGPSPLRDSVAGRKCSMPPASHSPGGCRPPAGGCPPVAPGQRVPYAYTDLFSFQLLLRRLGLLCEELLTA